MRDAVLWLDLLTGFVAPLLHVALSRRSGPWLPPSGARCPFGPRTGWLTIVLMLGPVGWLLYMRARGRRVRNNSVTS
jgi:hypothetical protein